MKKCPHCHEETFGLHELFLLDYFSCKECKACGKLVRNDGFRQFLLLPTILVALFLGSVIFFSFPNSLQPFGFLLLIVSVALPVILLAKPVKIDYSRREVTPFTPDLRNDKMIMLKGWYEDELHKILDDFVEEDTSVSPISKVEVHKHDQVRHRLTFPEDLSPSEFASLVNYLAYPTNFDLAGRSITVAGLTTLNADFQGIPQSLLRKKAIIYVPENDQDYDVVYLQTETGVTLSNSLREGVWRNVNDPRLSNEVRMLIW